MHGISRPDPNNRRTYLSKSCDLCPRNAHHSCKNCGRSVCIIHFKSESGLCTICNAAKVRKESAPVPHATMVLGQCAVCNNDAKHKCRNCGKEVCDSHFNSAMNICIMCANRKAREEMKMDGR